MSSTLQDAATSHASVSAPPPTPPPAAIPPNLPPPLPSTSRFPIQIPGSRLEIIQHELDRDFQAFLSCIFGIAIFGASTFAVIVGQLTDPADISDPPPITLATVRLFLGIAWLFFILTFALAAVISVVLTFLRVRQAVAGGEKKALLDDEVTSKLLLRFTIGATLCVHFSIVAAFFFLSLVLRAYSGVVGWVAIGICALAAVGAVMLAWYRSRLWLRVGV